MVLCKCTGDGGGSFREAGRCLGGWVERTGRGLLFKSSLTASEEGPLSLYIYLLCSCQGPRRSLGTFLWGSSLEPQVTDGAVVGSMG